VLKIGPLAAAIRLIYFPKYWWNEAGIACRDCLFPLAWGPPNLPQPFCHARCL